MRFLGLCTGMIAQRLGLSNSSIDVAGRIGCRGSRWLPALSQLIDVPVEMLLDISPEDPAAGEYRLRALLRAADIRFECPAPLATPAGKHQAEAVGSFSGCAHGPATSRPRQ